MVSYSQLIIFSWGEGESQHRIGSISCISLVASWTLVPCLSKRWARGTGGIALIQADISEVLAQKICPIRRHQWSASHSPHHKWIMRTSTSHPHANPFPCQTLFIDMAESGISEFSCCLSSFILRHKKSEVCFCQCRMVALFVAILTTKSVFPCVSAGKVWSILATWPGFLVLWRPDCWDAVWISAPRVDNTRV